VGNGVIALDFKVGSDDFGGRLPGIKKTRPSPGRAEFADLLLSVVASDYSLMRGTDVLVGV
jgi:hypothetical protein